ncbi:MAG TPA: PAS domain S-box protein [Spirochaetota bacterium]|nr:PAS domain S-box protein [Spirochaetota bacterium]
MEQKNYKTILLVEDEAITSLAEAHMLKRHGYTVLTAYTGKEAVDIARENEDIDIILMDIDLGTGIDGTQAAENILKNKRIPILFLSSHTEQEIVDKTEKITSFGYVVKNSGETVLIASIRMAFRLYDAYLLNEAKSIELQSANEQLEGTNEELQASMEELIRTNDELEQLLIQHKLSEQALRESEGKYRNLVDNMDDAVYQTDINGNIIFTNPAAARILGCSSVEEIIGKNVAADFYYHPEEREQLIKTLREQGKITHFEATLKRKDNGKPVIVSANSQLYRDRDGTIMGVEGVYSDITEHKKAEQALRESEREFRSLFDASPAGICVMKDRHFHKVNALFCKMTGYSSEELVGRSAHIFYTDEEEYRRVGREVYGRMEREGRSIGEARIRHKNGRMIDVLITACPIDPLDHSTGAVLTLLEITDIKQAEEALRTREAILNSIFQASTAGIALLVNRTLIKINQSLCKITGYSEKELVGRTTQHLYINDDEFNRIGELHKVLERGEIGVSEARLRRKDGKIVNALINLSPVNPDKLQAGIIATVLDITEQKRAIRALKKSEENYRSLVNNMQDAVYRADLDGDLTFVTPSAARILGFTSPEAMIGLNLSKDLYYYPDERERLLAALNEQGKVTQYEILLKRAGTGEKIVILTNSQFFFGRDGNIAGVEGVFNDITDRKRAEEELARSNALLNTIIDAVPAPIIGLDSRGKVNLVWNRAAENMFGWKAEEVMGKLLPTIPWKDQEDITKFIQWVQSGEHVPETDVEEYRRDGSRVNVNIYSSALRDHEGNITGNIAVLIDITERKKEEEARKKIENEFRSLFESVPVGVGLLQNRRFVNVNPALSKISGYTREDMITSLTRILYPDDEEFQRIGKELYKQMDDKGLGIIDARLKHKNGTLIDVMLYLFPVDPNDRTGTIAAIVVDITDRKKTENTLEKMLKDKQSLLRELQHRIKNNLAMITHIISLEMETPVPRDANTVLESIKGRINSLTSLYDHLFQTDAVTEVRLDQYLHSVINSFINTYATEIGAIQFNQKYDTVTVRTKDATAIGLIVNELVTNAFKHAFSDKKAGVISVKLAREQDGIELSVSDNGTSPGGNFDIDHPAGFGLLLIKTLAEELGGNLSFTRQDHENIFSIHIKKHRDCLPDNQRTI